VIHSAWFFFLSGAMMLVASAFYLAGKVVSKRSIMTFVAGGLFVIAGNYGLIKCH